jgi:hypothetical protein
MEKGDPAMFTGIVTDQGEILALGRRATCAPGSPRPTT